jgi:hypothetical protein
MGDEKEIQMNRRTDKRENVVGVDVRIKKHYVNGTSMLLQIESGYRSTVTVFLELEEFSSRRDLQACCEKAALGHDSDSFVKMIQS